MLAIGKVAFGSVDDWAPDPGSVVSWQPSPISLAKARQAPKVRCRLAVSKPHTLVTVAQALGGRAFSFPHVVLGHSRSM